jgi:hypothetical protein
MDETQLTLQYVLTGIIIVTAVGYACWRISQTLRNKENPCNGCSGAGLNNPCNGCDGCKLKKQVCEKKKEAQKFGCLK